MANATQGVPMRNRFSKTNLRRVVCGPLFLVTTINYRDRSALGLLEPILKHMRGGVRFEGELFAARKWSVAVWFFD
jgi:hypothetical protein